MQKKYFIFLISVSLIVHCLFAWYYPLIVDELNIWNMLDQHQNFSELWQYFIKYDTHQPLFYVAWFPFFSHSFNEFFLRCPSIILYAGSIYYWSKLFPYEKSENQIPWILFLFAPFITIYSIFFLPYSLLLFGSVYNFYRFQKLSENFSLKNMSFFFMSSLILIFTHYYGALQAILLGIFFIYQQKNVKLKLISGSAVIVLAGLLLGTTDFINDFFAVHSYRKIPGLVELLGAFNLLAGGRYVVIILFSCFLMKRKTSLFKTKEFIFIVTVIFIAYLKSILISPSFEARYLLILIYPIYFLLKDLQLKYVQPALVVACLISLILLEKSFGPSFVINYNSFERSHKNIGLLITPCPKYYFREDNYICKDYFSEADALKANVEKIIVHKDHMIFFKTKISTSECKEMEQSLFECSF